MCNFVDNLRKSLDSLLALYKSLVDDAKKNNVRMPLSSPVRDGVADLGKYVNSRMKVVWLLKEPYDSGKATVRDGGWSIVEDCFSKAGDLWERKRQDGIIDRMWTNRTWQMVAYIMHGVRNDKQYKDMDRIRSEKGRAIMNNLLDIGWLNASKFANCKNSSDARVFHLFKYVWASLVERQLQVLDPDVIICGKTFRCLQYIWSEKLRKDEQISKEARMEVWRKDKAYVINAYHPGRKGCKYANSMIKVIGQIMERIGGDK